MPNFEGDKIALEHDYNRQDPVAALNDFKSAREESISRFKSLTAEQFKRTGELEGAGAVNLENLMCLMLEHDRAHLKELKVLAEWLSEKS